MSFKILIIKVLVLVSGTYENLMNIKVFCCFPSYYIIYNTSCFRRITTKIFCVTVSRSFTFKIHPATEAHQGHNLFVAKKITGISNFTICRNLFYKHQLFLICCNFYFKRQTNFLFAAKKFTSIKKSLPPYFFCGIEFFPSAASLLDLQI